MATKTFKPDYAGYLAAMNQAGVQSEIMRRANAMATAAGDGYSAKRFDGDGNTRPSSRRRIGSDYAVVSPDTYEAYADNLNNNTLLKSIGAGRA